MDTSRLPRLNVISLALPLDGDEEALLTMLQEQEKELRSSRRQILIVDLSQYAVQAATPRHIQIAATWLSAQHQQRNYHCLAAALVIKSEVVETAWRLLMEQSSLPTNWAIFNDLDVACEWASRQLRRNRFAQREFSL